MSRRSTPSNIRFAVTFAAMLIVSVFVANTQLLAQDFDSIKYLRIPISQDDAESMLFQLTVNRQPIQQLEDQVLEQIYHYFDRDDDRRLSAEECQRLPDLTRLDDLLWNPLSMRPSVLTTTEKREDKSFQSPQHFLQWCRERGVRFTHIGTGSDQSNVALNERLTSVLNDLPRRNSSESLQFVRRVFEKFDRDSNGKLSANELVRDIAYPSCTANQPVDCTKDVLLIKRDSNKTFVLDLAKYPELAGSYILRDSPSNKSSSVPIDSTYQKFGQTNSLQLFIRSDSGTALENMETCEQSLRDGFNLLDCDNDGLLSVEEMQSKTARLIRDVAVFADRDCSGTLTEEELASWLMLLGTMVRSQLQISVLTQPVGKWEIADKDLDGKLSSEEWQVLWEQSLSDTRPLSGEPAHATDSKQLRITISRGRPLTLLGQPLAVGPDWFQSADTNQDKILDKQEFVGSLKAFAELDSNADGKISLSEVESL